MKIKKETFLSSKSGTIDCDKKGKTRTKPKTKTKPEQNLKQNQKPEQN